MIFRWQPAVSPRWMRVAVPANSGLNKVYCASTINCWAVGVVTSLAENILHWDGSTWRQVGVAGGRVTDSNLNDVSSVAAVRDRAYAVRKEEFK